MPEEMHVAVGTWQTCVGCVAPEEGLDLACPESALATDEERRIGVGA